MVQVHRNHLARGAAAYSTSSQIWCWKEGGLGFLPWRNLSLLDKVEQHPGLPTGQFFNCLQDVCSFLSRSSKTWVSLQDGSGSLLLTPSSPTTKHFCDLSLGIFQPQGICTWLLFLRLLPCMVELDFLTCGLIVLFRTPQLWTISFKFPSLFQICLTLTCPFGEKEQICPLCSPMSKSEKRLAMIKRKRANKREGLEKLLNSKRLPKKHGADWHFPHQPWAWWCIYHPNARAAETSDCLGFTGHWAEPKLWALGTSERRWLKKQMEDSWGTTAKAILWHAHTKREEEGEAGRKTRRRSWLVLKMNFFSLENSGEGVMMRMR